VSTATLRAAIYRVVVHVSFAFGRVLVKYDRIDPETVSWRKK
jgi:mRNA interferase HigB